MDEMVLFFPRVVQKKGQISKVHNETFPSRAMQMPIILIRRGNQEQFLEAFCLVFK